MNHPTSQLVGIQYAVMGNLPQIGHYFLVWSRRATLFCAAYVAKPRSQWDLNPQRVKRSRVVTMTTSSPWLSMEY